MLFNDIYLDHILLICRSTPKALEYLENDNRYNIAKILESSIFFR